MLFYSLILLANFNPAFVLRVIFLPHLFSKGRNLKLSVKLKINMMLSVEKLMTVAGMESTSRVRGSAGKRPPASGEEKVSAFNFSQAWRARSQLPLVGLPWSRA